MSAHYILHICLPDSDEQLVEIEDKLIFGADEQCDVCFPEDGIDAQHLTFRVNNGVLTVKNHSTIEPKLGNSTLKRRKMVIIDQGDIITINDLQLKVSKKSEEDNIDDKASNEEELPTATTLFKLAKAEIEEEGEQIFTDVISTDALSTEDKTGEFDLSETLDEEDEDYDVDTPKKKSIFSFLSFLKKKKVDGDMEVDDEEQTEVVEDNSKIKTTIISDNKPTMKSLKKRDNDDDEQETVTPKKKPLGFITRIYLLFTSYSIAYTFYNLFEDQINTYLHHPVLLQQLNQPFITDQLKLITPYWQMIPADIAQLILKLYPLVLLVTLQDILFSVLLGFPLPFFLIGATQKGNFLLRRITSLMRSILGLLHPLLIFDLPLLFSKPTLKEILTVTTIYSSHAKVKSILGKLIMIPLVLILCTAAPILFSPHFSSTGVSKFPNQTIITAPSTKTQNFNSLNYHLNIKNVTNEILFIPVRFNTKNKKLNLKLFKKNNYLSISITPFTEIKGLISYLRTYNPIYNFLAPADLTADDLEKLFSTIFDLSFKPETLKSFVLTQGPLLFPALKLKYTLMQMLNIRFIDSYQIITTQKSHFIRIIEAKQAHIISLSPPYLKFSYQLNGKQKALADAFPSIFLSNLLPSRKKKLQQTENILSYENSLDPFFYIDLVTSKGLTKQTTDYYKQYLKELSNKAKTDISIATQEFKTSIMRFKKLHTSLCPACETGKKDLKENPKKLINKRDRNKTIKRKRKIKKSKRRK